MSGGRVNACAEFVRVCDHGASLVLHKVKLDHDKAEVRAHGDAAKRLESESKEGIELEGKRGFFQYKELAHKIAMVITSKGDPGFNGLDFLTY